MAATPNRISGLAVRGFKSIQTEQHVDLRPLTILAGANSSGKSSIMQPLLLLKQTLEAPSDPGALLLDGPNVRFTKADQLLAREPPEENRVNFSVRVELLSKHSLEVVFHRDREKGFDIHSMKFEDAKQKAALRYGMTSEEITRIIPKEFLALIKRMQESEKTTLTWKVGRQRCFLSLELVSGKDATRRIFFGGDWLSPSGAFVPLIQGIIHLPALRGNPLRTYSKAGGGPNFQGTFESYAASVVYQWQNEGDRKLENLRNVLEDLGLTWKVEARPVEDTQVELKVGRLIHGKQGGAYDLVNIADVGFGVSQCLPVIVALLAARPGQLVYLEQPEIHLHPKAERKLANVLCEAANRGVVVVAETHSSLLLREVMTRVATGKLSRENVALHWFQRDENGSTTVKTADLDEHGAFGDWPADFDQVELEAEQAYLDASDSR